MHSYILTVFDDTGKKLLDESFEAVNDEEAKKMGTARLGDENFTEFTHRCVSPDAKLILFQR